MKELRLANAKQQKFQPEVEGFLRGVEDGFFFFFFQTIENSLVEKQVTFCIPPRRKSKSINYLRVETMSSILLYSW